jgi:hypothetical protein
VAHDACSLTAKTTSSHELVHVFGTSLSSEPIPEKAIGAPYERELELKHKPKATAHSSSGETVTRGERGSLWEELHCGGRLGAFFLEGKQQQWTRCCGLFVNVSEDGEVKQRIISRSFAGTRGRY